MNVIEYIFSWFVVGNAAFIAGFSAVILLHYAKHAHRHMVHISLMATSFILLVFLSAAASNFKIFYDGINRDIANLVLFIALVLADIGMLTLWRHRTGKGDGPMHVTQT